MSHITRLVELYDEGGVHEVARGVCDWLYWQVGIRLPVQPGYETVTTARSEATFRTTTRAERNRYRTLMREEAVIVDMQDRLAPEHVLWDVGANTGLYTCLMEPLVRRVVAFEPVESNYERLVENAHHNRLVNINLCHVGLGRQLEMCGFSAELGSGGSYVGPDQEAIHLADAEDVIHTCEVPPPDVLKVDVEGAELAVLEGLGRYIDGVDLIYLEVHHGRLDVFDDTIDGLEDYLWSSGFEWDVINRRGDDNEHWRCVRVAEVAP